MTLLILSFLAGVLTVAAPCTLTLLPVIVGGTLVRSGELKAATSWKRPLIVASSLALSILLFTLMLKATTALLGVPVMVWQTVSGVIIILLGLTMLWPRLWETTALKTGLYLGSNKFLGRSLQTKGLGGDIMTGAALGPVFSSCSPTYAFVVASVIPSSFGTGLVYLLMYCLGLAGALLIITYAGQGLVSKLGWLQDPRGLFKRFVASILIIVGLGVALGADKKLEEALLNNGWYEPISNLENSLR